MNISICLKHNIELIPISKLQGKCPIDDEIFTLSHVSLDEFAWNFPAASVINQAYDPRWNGSTLGHIEEIAKKYRPRNI